MLLLYSKSSRYTFQAKIDSPPLRLAVAATVGVSGIGHLGVVRRVRTLKVLHAGGGHFVCCPDQAISIACTIVSS